MKETVIEVIGLSFRYPGSKKPALNGLSFEVKKGEIFLLAGETGCGKSTLLSVLCGLIPWTASGEFSGRVEVLGRLWPVSPQELFPEVVTVFQTTGEHLLAETVFSEIAFGLENLGYSPEKIRKRVESALSSVGLEGFGERKLSTLSGGEAQRVALAAALAVGAKILLLDEPLAQLDPEAAQKIMELLRGLASNGLTIVLAEHRLQLALPFVDRICFLKEGQISFLGPQTDFSPPKKTYLRPRTGPKGRRLVEIKGLTYRYGSRTIFQGLELSFRAGECVALLGPNGSGKTTLLHLLAGLLKPQRGEVRYLFPRKKASLPVTLLLQDPDLMLLRENVFSELAFAPQNLGLPSEEIRHRVEEIAESLRLSPYLSRPPFSLSRGERLRVALGSLLTAAPKVLLLDEPTTAQDPENMSRLLKTLKAELIIFSTHEEEVAFTLANRVLRLKEGRIIEEEQR